MRDLLKKFWPDILAVLLFIADYASKRLNDYAATHEHSTLLVMLIAALAAWHAQHLKPGSAIQGSGIQFPPRAAPPPSQGQPGGGSASSSGKATR